MGLNEAQWNRMLDEGDKIRGPRYYLPRPWIVVKKEYPVAGGTYFLQATIDEHGRIQVDQASLGRLDPGLRERLEAPLPSSSVKEGREPEGRTTQGEPSLKLQFGDNDDNGGKPDGLKAPKNIAWIDDKGFLTVNAPKGNDAQVPSADHVVSFEAVVKNDALDAAEHKQFAGNGAFDKPALFLVPFVSGKHDASKAIAFEATTATPDQANKVTKFEGQLSAKKIPAQASLAVGILVGDSNSKQRHLLHESVADVFNSFATTTSDKEPEPKDSEGQKNGKEEKLKSGAENKDSATVRASGDPATDPLTELTDAFDILLLPDFTEQYAVSVSSGLGAASYDLGLENGWMVERFEAEADNEKLGAFVYETVGKIVDLGITALMPQAAVADAIAAAPPVDMETIQPQAGSHKIQPVVLQVVYLEVATLGPHPMIKALERRAAGEVGAVGPRIDYRTRSRVEISLVEIKGDLRDAPNDLDQVSNALKEIFQDPSFPTNDEFAKLFETKKIQCSVEDLQRVGSDGLTLVLKCTGLASGKVLPNTSSPLTVEVLAEINAALKAAGRTERLTTLKFQG